MLFLFRLLIFILGYLLSFIFLIFGYLLIRTAHEEIKRREEIEGLVVELEKEKKLAEVHKEIVEERTRRLERFYQSTVGGELKMVELKEKIKELEEKLRKRE